MLIRMRRQSGLSLIELMIAMAIGLLLLGAAAAIGLNSLSGSRDGLRSIVLQQELQSVMTIVTRELRRAGYNALSTDDPSDTSRQFRKIWFDAPATGGSNDYTCAVFRYDRAVIPLGGAAPTGAGVVVAGEVTGFHFVQTDTGTPSRSNRLFLLTAAPDIGVSDCDGNGWEALNDPERLKITRFTIVPSTITPSASAVNLVQSVTVTLTGQAGNGPESRTLTETVQLRNLPVPQ
ncbi:prepilin-type N-terminal cleavage/methylation domain-containing protein [Jeongeupia sp. USM3]|uniref:prepilin-type N-terminal cleavage/methylation domain-containing protein n=1 Tax=Jeongeupia sp. USM3 TaxID=1906741 RepID=UPI00089E0235|nr:prepilin-type N-terminal cleavage/methylation domain-containing protein [Jeongeupia sp. USM3]AOX99658.1 hypothetical protein BJP62_03825 [Jeongeupia sp. USM3]